MFTTNEKWIFSHGNSELNKKKNNIIIWKPNDLYGYYYLQTLEGHKSYIIRLTELKDGRLVSSSKDRTIKIWKSNLKEDKNKQNSIHFQIDEILNEHKHGMFLIMQLNDGRIFSSTLESVIVIWKFKK